jgi:hypothetical protein
MFARTMSVAACAAMLMSFSADASTPTPADGFIVVNADGTVARASKGYDDSKYDVGGYEISYPSPLYNCAWSVTEGTSDGTNPIEGFATVIGRAENPLIVHVQTYNSAGQKADAGFHLIVRC